MIGHLLGAAGAAEAIFSLLAIATISAPPTINLDNPERETPIDLVPNKPRKSDRRRAPNSFGFRGTSLARMPAFYRLRTLARRDWGHIRT